MFIAAGRYGGSFRAARIVQEHRAACLHGASPGAAPLFRHDRATVTRSLQLRRELRGGGTVVRRPDQHPIQMPAAAGLRDAHLEAPSPAAAARDARHSRGSRSCRAAPARRPSRSCPPAALRPSPPRPASRSVSSRPVSPPPAAPPSPGPAADAAGAGAAGGGGAGVSATWALAGTGVGCSGPLASVVVRGCASSARLMV